MPKIEWKESLNIGIPKIDSQHKELINIVNQVLQSIEKEKGPEIISEILSKLREYTVLHFNEEEAFMKEIEYPRRRDQQQQHKELKQTVKGFQYAHFYKAGLDLDEIKKLLSDWLLNHILESDTGIARYVNERQAKAQEEKEGVGDIEE